MRRVCLGATARTALPINVPAWRPGGSNFSPYSTCFKLKSSMNDTRPAGPNLSGIHILVVEDDEVIRELLADILALEGAEVTTACSGNEAAALLRGVRPQLIVCDVMMPDGDGHELLRSVQADPMLNGVPFIFLTARSEPGDHRQSMNMGADDYLVKPVLRQDLVDAVRARLARSRAVGFCQRELGSEFRDDCARRVAAELMNPLVTIRGVCEALQADSVLSEGTRELLATLVPACDRMASSVKRFWRLLELQTTLNRLPVGKHVQSVPAISPYGVFLEEAAKIIATSSGRSADLALELQAVRFPMAEPDLVLLMRELVENAFRFSPPGSRVSVFMGACDRGVSLIVRDQGREMSPAEVESIQQLLQGCPDHSSCEPRGMGLTIVDTIARVYGFRVTFTPEQPRGLRVAVSKSDSNC